MIALRKPFIRDLLLLLLLTWLFIIKLKTCDSLVDHFKINCQNKSEFMKKQQIMLKDSKQKENLPTWQVISYSYKNIFDLKA